LFPIISAVHDEPDIAIFGILRRSWQAENLVSGDVEFGCSLVSFQHLGKLSIDFSRIHADKEIARNSGRLQDLVDGWDNRPAHQIVEIDFRRTSRREVKYGNAA
jgi:hypothetical protein